MQVSITYKFGERDITISVQIDSSVFSEYVGANGAPSKNYEPGYSVGFKAAATLSWIIFQDAGIAEKLYENEPDFRDFVKSYFEGRARLKYYFECGEWPQ